MFRLSCSTQNIQSIQKSENIIGKSLSRVKLNSRSEPPLFITRHIQLCTMYVSTKGVYIIQSCSEECYLDTTP